MGSRLKKKTKNCLVFLKDNMPGFKYDNNIFPCLGGGKLRAKSMKNVPLDLYIQYVLQYLCSAYFQCITGNKGHLFKIFLFL